MNRDFSGFVQYYFYYSDDAEGVPGAGDEGWEDFMVRPTILGLATTNINHRI
jgi:hypothetical protein